MMFPQCSISSVYVKVWKLCFMSQMEPPTWILKECRCLACTFASAIIHWRSYFILGVKYAFYSVYVKIHATKFLMYQNNQLCISDRNKTAKNSQETNKWNLNINIILWLQDIHWFSTPHEKIIFLRLFQAGNFWPLHVLFRFHFQFTNILMENTGQLFSCTCL